MSRSPSIEPRFELPPWLRNAHVQTLGAALPLWLAGPEPSSESVMIPLLHGEQGRLHGRVDWHDGAAPRAAVVVAHGVGGTSESRYAIRAARALRRAGFHVLRIDLRGAGEGVREAPSLYHAALTRDLAAAVAWLGGSPRVDGVFVLGFSLGGHIALRWAGELGSDVEARGPLRAIAALSAPLDLELTTRAIERRRSAPYHRYIARGLQQQGHAFATLHPERAHYTLRELARVRTVRQYDTLVIAPMHGWRSAEDYYAEASAGPWLSRIEVPTLVVHAEDDPMVPATLVKGLLATAAPAVEQSWSAHGGHVGWFAGLGERAWLNTWAIDRVLEFFRRQS